MNFYNVAEWVWLGSSAAALLIAIVSLIQALIGWRRPQRNRRLVRFAIAIVALPVLLVGFKALVRHVIVPRDRERERMERGDPATLVRVGDLAPRAALQEVHGKVVLVNFFATWCGPCIEELPHLQKIWEENRNNPRFAMLVIGREETDAAVTEFQTKHGFTFPLVADPERSIYSQYAKEIIPRTYLVSPDGNICFASVGYYEADLKRLRKELERQLGGEQN